MSVQTVRDVAINLRSQPDEALACLGIAGEIDMAAEAALADAVDWLSAVMPRTVLVDVAAVTFACSTLVNLLVRLHNVLPDGASLVVCRPTPRTRLLLELTALSKIVALRDDLPPEGVAPVAASQFPP
jgi:anti-anti-sigma factor